MHIAAENGYIDIIKLLFESNEDFHLRDKDGNTVLHLAIMCRKTAAADQILKHFGSKNVVKREGAKCRGDLINVQNNNGKTALHISADYGYVKILEKINQLNGDLRLQDEHGSTALHLSVMSKKSATVQFICSALGVKIDDVTGGTAAGIKKVDVIGGAAPGNKKEKEYAVQKLA